jgi:ribonucleoside-diphosphate reductase beta chain
MQFSIFNRTAYDHLKQPMFFGENVNVSRYDSQRHPIFEKLIDKQISFFWRPEEVDLSRDRIDFMEKLDEHELHIFVSNLKYQTLLDSIQGRSPNIAFLPVVSTPELETWIETWSFFETIHSRSYTHIIRNIFPNPSVVLDDIVKNPEIIKRAASISQYYDALIEGTNYYSLFGEGVHEINGKSIRVSKRDLKRRLYLTMVSVNVLEAVRFYVSFACSFAFAERQLMEGNAKLIRFIARDEALHLAGTQEIIKIIHDGKDDPEMQEIARECEGQVYQIFITAAEQEKEWAKYLFKDGSMMGLNADILCQYVEYITNNRLRAIGFKNVFSTTQNPLPWINSWLVSDNVQVAPQEAEIASYVVGQIDNAVHEDAFAGFDL